MYRRREKGEGGRKRRDILTEREGDGQRARKVEERRDRK